VSVRAGRGGVGRDVGEHGIDTYRRRAEVKPKYDPENVFHNSKNIQPSTPAL
jgi:hypothetical protein